MTTENDERAQTISLLRAIAMADKARYEHHEKRERDGKRPEGGTIWLTPRQMALRALERMGEETESLYFPFRTPPAPAQETGGSKP
jgi:hypothetical protein